MKHYKLVLYLVIGYLGANVAFEIERKFLVKQLPEVAQIQQDFCYALFRI